MNEAVLRFGGVAPPEIDRRLRDAAIACADTAHAERLLNEAHMLDPECLPVYFALYKFHFYKARLAERAARGARHGRAPGWLPARLDDTRSGYDRLVEWGRAFLSLQPEGAGLHPPAGRGGRRGARDPGQAGGARSARSCRRLGDPCARRRLGGAHHGRAGESRFTSRRVIRAGTYPPNGHLSGKIAVKKAVSRCSLIPTGLLAVTPFVASRVVVAVLVRHARPGDFLCHPLSPSST